MSKKNPNDYSDCAVVLDLALSRGGGIYTLPNHAAAVRWAQRAYNLRKALRELQEPTLLPGQAPFTKYDDVILRVEKKREDKSNPHTVTIELKRLQGTLTDLEGNTLEPPHIKSVTPGPTEDELNAWMEDLG